MAAVSRYFGLSRTELQNRLQSGESLADVAEAEGKSVSGRKDAMVSELRTSFDSNRTLSPDDREAAAETDDEPHRHDAQRDPHPR